MGGGIMQLALKSGMDPYLFDNPDINFYAYAYRKHANFAFINIKLDPQTSSTVKVVTDIEKEYEFVIIHDTTTDFLNNLYLTFTFPDIYSNDTYRFKWVEHAGTLLIKKATIYYNNNEIETITGEWLIIWLELTTPVKDSYNVMTGNIPEMTNPRTNENIYRIKNNIITESDYPNSNKTNTPSINKRKVSIPLAFYFTRCTRVAFPLLYINNSQIITLKITIRPIEELYTIYSDIFNMNISSKYYNTLYKNKISINNFLKEDFAPNIYVEATYISIDNVIRDTIINTTNATYTYIYQKISYIDEYLPTGADSIEGSTRSYEIRPNKLPVKEYIWTLRREDSILKFNDYFNYTNSIPRNNNDGIMKSASIRWNKANEDRIEERDAFFYNNIQPYQFHTCIPPQGIYCYSHSVFPEKCFPSGSANVNDTNQTIYMKLGKYNDNLLNILYKKKYPNLSYETPTAYKLDIYIVQHNIMLIVSNTMGFIN